MDQFGISKLDLKRRNRMQILKLLRQKGPTSRIDISAALELTRAAVTIITNEMIEQGVIYEKGEMNLLGQKAARGRKKILLDINSNYKFAFGVVVDAGCISIGLSNINGEVLDKQFYTLDPQDKRPQAVHKIREMIAGAKANNCLDDSDILGVGVGVSESEYARMQVAVEHYVPDLTGLKKELEQAVGMPVTVHETVRALALAEIDFDFKEQVKPRNMVFIRYGDEIDAAVVLQNRIYSGTNNRAARFGHMIVNPGGKECSCGRVGCTVTEISRPALLGKVRQVYSKEQTPALFEATGGNPDNVGVLVQNVSLQFADKPVAEIFKNGAEYFAIAVNHMITLFDPEKVVFFGDICLNKAFLEYVKARMAHLAHYRLEDMVKESVISKKMIYLAGCAVAIREFFIERGGFDR